MDEEWVAIREVARADEGECEGVEGIQIRGGDAGGDCVGCRGVGGTIEGGGLWDADRLKIDDRLSKKEIPICDS